LICLLYQWNWTNDNYNSTIMGRKISKQKEFD
jgi:hypothetical protein